MIELLIAERCTGCNICVQACPTDVFAPVAGGPPVLARQEDCQTCFMCELYCPEDALYVAPLADRREALHADDPRLQPLLGSYRESVGWGKGRRSTAVQDASHELMRRAH